MTTYLRRFLPSSSSTARIAAIPREASRALVPQLEGAGPEPEPVSGQAERLLYYALVGALEAGLVRTVEDALTRAAPGEPAARTDGDGMARAAGAGLEGGR